MAITLNSFLSFEDFRNLEIACQSFDIEIETKEFDLGTDTPPMYEAVFKYKETKVGEPYKGVSRVMARYNAIQGLLQTGILKLSNKDTVYYALASTKEAVLNANSSLSDLDAFKAEIEISVDAIKSAADSYEGIEVYIPYSPEIKHQYEDDIVLYALNDMINSYKIEGDVLKTLIEDATTFEEFKNSLDQERIAMIQRPLHFEIYLLEESLSDCLDTNLNLQSELLIYVYGCVLDILAKA